MRSLRSTGPGKPGHACTPRAVDTPTRVAREEERKMLEKLNGRLEAFIARLRQIEEENKQLTSKLAATQETALRKEEDMRQRHEAEVAGLRDEKYNDTKLIAEQKATIHELQGHLTTARSEASTNKGAAQQLQKVQAQLLSLQSERDMLQVSVDEATAKLQATEAKLQLAEKAAKAHEQKLAPLRENLTNIEEMRKKENAAFRDQLAELRAAHQKELDEKRASFETQLMEALETQKTNLEAQQDQQRAEVGARPTCGRSGPVRPLTLVFRSCAALQAFCGGGGLPRRVPPGGEEGAGERGAAGQVLQGGARPPRQAGG